MTPKYPVGTILRSEANRLWRITAVTREGLYELVDIFSRAKAIEAIAYADRHWALVSEEERAA